jgi:uncharacterized OsmC-like protein
VIELLISVSAFSILQAGLPEEEERLHMGVMTVSTRVRPEDLAVVAEARGHGLDMDQSKQNGGREDTMKPMEVVLAALGGCITMVALARAPKEGLDIRDLRLGMEGEYSAAGGFRTIRMTARLRSSSPEDRLVDFFHAVERVCPVSNSLKARIELEVVREQ